MTAAIAILVALPCVLATGDDRTREDLIRETLAELVEAQEEDGRWTAPEGPPGGLTDEGMTALALFVFAGSGGTHRHGDHKESIRRGLDFLKRRLGEKGEVPGGVLNQALVTMAISELYAITMDFTIKRTTRQTTLALVKRQLEDGGFGKPDAGGTFETAIASMALRASEHVKVKMVIPMFQERVRKYLRGRIDPETLTPEGKTDPLEAQGSAAAIYVGLHFARADKDDDLLKALATHLGKATYSPGDPRGSYFVIYTLFLAESPGWKGFAASHDRWVADGERSKDLVGRCFETLCLQFRERYDRLHRFRE